MCVDGPTNAERAAWAATALDAFGELTGQVGYDYGDPTLLLEIAGDLVCNLLHLARQAGVSCGELRNRGTFHFEEEVREEDHVIIDSDGNETPC